MRVRPSPASGGKRIVLTGILVTVRLALRLRLVANAGRAASGASARSILVKDKEVNCSVHIYGCCNTMR